MKKRTDHLRVKGTPVTLNNSYGRNFERRTDTCDTCGFIQEDMYVTQSGRPTAWDIQKWEMHVRAYESEPLGLHRPEGSGQMVGRIHRFRGKPNELWVYHAFDPDLPSPNIGWMRRAIEARDMALGLAVTRRDEWRFVDIPWVYVHSWMLLQVQQNGLKLVGSWIRREEVLMKVQNILTKEANKGYRVESTLDDALMEGAEAPLADMITYLDRFLKDALGARSMRQVHEYLTQIEHMRNQWSTIDELEETLQARLMGGLLDL